MRSKWAVAAAVIIGIVLSGAPALAAPSGAAASPVQQCAAQAVSQKLDSWMCFGGELTYPSVEVVNGSPTAVVKTKRVAAETSSPAGGATIQSHDYDTWCEFGTVCTRFISDYISETKGNAAYGNRSGVIGTFDAVIRTNLNGRQAQWRVYWYHDTGPSLSFRDAYIYCRKAITALPDTSCGTHAADNGDGDFYLGTGSIATPPTVYGNRLNDSDEYYAHLESYFTPSGYPQYTMGSLKTAEFNCYGTSRCIFP